MKYKEDRLDKFMFYTVPVMAFTCFGIYLTAIYLSVQFLYGGS